MNARIVRLVALSAMAAGLLAAILLPRVRSVQFHGEIRAASVGFTLAGPGLLLERNALDWISVEGVTRLDGPQTTLESADARVSLLDTLVGPGALRLSRLRLPPAARVEVQTGLGSGFVELAFACEGGCDAFQLDTDGRQYLRLNDAAGPVQGRRYYRLTGGEGATTLLVRAARRGEPLDIGRNLRVTRVAFTRVTESSTDGVQRESETVSSVWHGTLRFAGLSDRAHELTPGSQLLMDLEKAAIEDLSVRADTIVVSFSGVARGIRVGSGAGERELMPRRIEWLDGQRTFMLLVGCVTGLITLALTIRSLLERRS